MKESEKLMTVAICGCGNRGLWAYAPYQKVHPDRMKIVAGADVEPERLKLLQEEYGVPKKACYASAEALLAQPKLADVVFITTQDRQHVGHALAALEKGYHVLLEKPISPELDECRRLLRKARETGRMVLVCHVLRYTNFYGTIHQLIADGKIGKVETIDAMEAIGYWHFSHSYVRGNWRRAKEASPVIMAKCCHDMDILRWLVGRRCLRVSSYGSLDFFRAKNAPEGASRRCMDGCKVKDNCPYDAEQLYIHGVNTGFEHKGDSWPANVLTEHPSREAVYQAIQEGPYGRCVFHCDNDVADHQVTNMEFEDGITVSFTLTAFSNACHRTIRILGTEGEIQADIHQNKILFQRFGQPQEMIELPRVEGPYAGHGGGDMGLIDYLYQMFIGEQSEALTGIEASIESHVMALAAEESRNHSGRSIELEEFFKS